MSVYAVVPVKNLAASKCRLSEVFTPQERKLLTLAMLEDVLNAIQMSIADKILVVAEDLEVQQKAEKFAASYLSASQAGLNTTIEEATSWCMRKSAASVLVLPADIPLVTAKEIDCVIELGSGGPAVVLSPSQNWGTNALYQNPPRLISACFGPGSFLKHIQEAYSRGVSVRLHFSAGIAIDIDSAQDLTKLTEIPNATLSRQFIDQVGAGKREK